VGKMVLRDCGAHCNISIPPHTQVRLANDFKQPHALASLPAHKSACMYACMHAHRTDWPANQTGRTCRNEMHQPMCKRVPNYCEHNPDCDFTAHSTEAVGGSKLSAALAEPVLWGNWMRHTLEQPELALHMACHSCRLGPHHKSEYGARATPSTQLYTYMRFQLCGRLQQ
jgi:hypothetical protein